MLGAFPLGAQSLSTYFQYVPIVPWVADRGVAGAWAQGGTLSNTWTPDSSVGGAWTPDNAAANTWALDAPLTGTWSPTVEIGEV